MVYAVHPHAQEESDQQRSEEETFTLPIISGWSMRCFTTCRRRTNSSVARRDIHSADQRLVDAVHHHLQEEIEQQHHSEEGCSFC